MPRLFTGLEIPDPIIQRLALLRGGLPGARWIPPENYHLTLRFVGDVDGPTAQSLADALTEDSRAPFRVNLARMDVFGGRQPRALIVGIGANPGMARLQADHEHAVRGAGLPPAERKFVPHVTLARLRRVRARAAADYLAQRGGDLAEDFFAERFVLFSARDSVGGGPYVVEQAYPLTGIRNQPETSPWQT